MATRITATDYIQSGFPTDEGERLADALLAEQMDFSSLEVDLKTCAPALLISAFFNGFLQRVFDVSPSSLSAAKNVSWIAKFPFQTENIERWVKDFTPQEELVK